VHIIDKRSHIAGNAYDHVGVDGIRIHAYGPHLFHTSNMKVVEFLSRFTGWLPYRHKVKAMLADGRLVTLPVNQETARIVGAENVLDIFFRPYTRKMWGVELDQLDPEILNRVPIRQDLNEDYFPNDTFQALPDQGYTALVDKMLDHPGIRTTLNCPFDRAMLADYEHVFNSMSIDEFFNFEHGTLPYRSIRFETQVVPVPRAFPVATVNFTHDAQHTRVTEWKNLPGHGDHPSRTVLTFETPCDFVDNHHERYYPVKDVTQKNRALYERYRQQVPSGMTFIGRCGLYAYLDMHQAVSAALATANEFITEKGLG
jgi:UDP-galactopyranose mutase